MVAHADELSFDLGKLKTFFKRADKEKLAMWSLIVIACIIVFSIRMLPAALPVTDDWATQTIYSNVRSQIASNVNREFPSLPAANRNALVEERLQEFIEQNGPTIESTKAQITNDIKTRLRYVGEDGKQYTYLGDLDSYFWLRYTRNWLETGTTCDVITEEGQCRDMFVLMPVGQPSSENPSSHVFMIGWLYKLITVFRPDYPLPATSFLVPVLAAVLGIFPAFFIGRRLAGNTGGFFAAILTALHPLALSRSMGSDNDIWNVVIPLFIMWMAIEALEAKDNKWRALYGGITGLLIGIHATFWAGWWFIYLIILFGFVGSLLFMIIRYVVRERKRTFWKDKTVQGLGLILLCFYVVAMISSVWAGVNDVQTYAKRPLLIAATGANIDRAIGDNYWPNVLTTVAELNKSSFAGAIAQMGGKLFFFGCLLGLLLLLLPRDLKKWTWEIYTLLSVGTLISIFLLNSSGLGFIGSIFGPKLGTLVLLCLPIGIILLLDVIRDYKVDVTAALIVLVWFLATVYATYSGVRFILLMIPAYGIGFAITVGRIYEWVSSYVRKEFKVEPAIVNVSVFIIIALLLMNPVQAGYGTARSFVPTIDDGWWDALTKIRDESSPEAVINSWWDFGHWFKYVAERRVTADGTTQGTHAPRWLGLALVTEDERESIGVLRMMNCGSDASPTIEGEFGAYGRVSRKVDDPIEAQEIVVDLVNRDADAAETYLQNKGFSSDDIKDIMNATHCPVIEDYFITSGDMVGKAGVWAHFGLWNFDRSFIAHHARSEPQAEAVPKIMEQLDMTEEEANKAYFDVLALASEPAVNAYVSPWPGYILGNWVGCTNNPNATEDTCNMGVNIGTNAQGVQTVVEGFVYNKTDESKSSLVIGFRQNGITVQRILQPPSRLLVASDDLYDVTTNSTGVNLGVLMDTKQHRVMLADPLLLGSTFTQLFYLDGRYNTYYKKFDDRSTFNGVRIITWKVDWDGEE